MQARIQLANLITYMDGKTGAEELIAKILTDRGLLETLAKPQSETKSE
jgi:type VI secretion system protein ImpB